MNWRVVNHLDEIPLELLKDVGDEMTTMTAVCNAIWDRGVWPNRWKQSIYVLLPKKGDPRICSNNGTIALISHASKILLKIIQWKLEPYMEKEMSIEQADFRKVRGNRDEIANLRWIMERSKELKRSVYMCFIDYSKAFDCVDHDTMWNIVLKMGIPGHLVTRLICRSRSPKSLIVKQKLSYFGHIMRKQSSLEKSIMLGMGEGDGRRRGRPCMRLKDDIKTVTGLTLSEMVRAVENGDDWRQLIATITRSRPRLDGTR
ncbi:RNA-directed DNA polymerase (Reverse transcriptase) domain containing protein [Elysia marginata]|uniref:RNA-directed DNA polymerase (Reverse transcriptase) domain containing protein n=1 Tax=Elysia marginata TaxID=1093978 RepID=A0AAV4IKG0_9GAST|nr:RNA-directed DNA polymerase (Reverse transcriptase) domain containing protein [Elysia marginata]